MLVGEVRAKHWIKLLHREDPEWGLEKQTPNFWQDAKHLLEISTEQV